MRKYATRRLVAKKVPITLAQYFPQGKFRLRGRGNRTYSALHAAIRPEKYHKYLGYEPETLDKMDERLYEIQKDGNK